MAIVRNIYGDDFMEIFKKSFENIDNDFIEQDGKLVKKDSSKEYVWTVYQDLGFVSGPLLRFAHIGSTFYTVYDSAFYPEPCLANFLNGGIFRVYAFLGLNT